MALVLLRRVSLLHGKMTSAEKNKRLSEFSEAEKGKGLRVLVSTSIIEVSAGWKRKPQERRESCS